MVKAQTNEVKVKAAKSVVSKSKDKKVSAKKESKKTAAAPESTEVPVTTEIVLFLSLQRAPRAMPTVVDANTALTNLLVDKRNDFNKKMTAVTAYRRNEG
jgi:non-canonical (house-cleaning) NTP pyrophosphatase